MCPHVMHGKLEQLFFLLAQKEKTTQKERAVSGLLLYIRGIAKTTTVPNIIPSIIEQHICCWAAPVVFRL